MALLQNETRKNMFKKVWCMFWPKYSKLLAWTSFAKFQNGNMCSLALNFYVWSFFWFCLQYTFLMACESWWVCGREIKCQTNYVFIFLFLCSDDGDFCLFFLQIFFWFLRSDENGFGRRESCLCEEDSWMECIGSRLLPDHPANPPNFYSNLEFGRNSEHFLHDLDFGRC